MQRLNSFVRSFLGARDKVRSAVDDIGSAVSGVPTQADAVRAAADAADVAAAEQAARDAAPRGSTFAQTAVTHSPDNPFLKSVGGDATKLTSANKRLADNWERVRLMWDQEADKRQAVDPLQNSASSY